MMSGFERRTHRVGDLRVEDVGRQVTLYGWVHRLRDLGGLRFLQLRDVAGLLQVVFDPTENQAMVEASDRLRPEWVVKVKGLVRARPEGQGNADMVTGAVEVLAEELEVLAESETPPFVVSGEGAGVSELTRLKYRYLDLRKPENQAKLVFRARLSSQFRRYLDDAGFHELETPILTKSTPEGARDFLVPSRISPGEFYALPQSPQLFKQLFMVSGFDRYYQICRCFRDEDLRADRQPEFTQLDVETSFTPPEQLFELIEGLFRQAAETMPEIRPPEGPFLRLPYGEAMARFGTDKPDMRFAMEIRNFSEELRGSGFVVFDRVLEEEGAVQALCVPGGASFSRKQVDGWNARAIELGARGLAWCKLAEGAVKGPLLKALGEERIRRLFEGAGGGEGDLLFFVAAEPQLGQKVLGQLRLELARDLDMIDSRKQAFLWVTEFPWLEYDDSEDRFFAMHHPFTKPVLSDLEDFVDSPGRIRAQAYDLVLNGSEIGGGSVRIHDPALQKRMFGYLGIGDEEAEAKFGFLLEALRFGAPPHAGIALGMDRVVALFTGQDSIRDVIAFPKTTRGQCPLTGAPTPVDPAQLAELGVGLTGTRNHEA